MLRIQDFKIINPDQIPSHPESVLILTAEMGDRSFFA